MVVLEAAASESVVEEGTAPEKAAVPTEVWAAAAALEELAAPAAASRRRASGTMHPR